MNLGPGSLRRLPLGVRLGLTALLVVFGIGSVFDSANARWQLACALALQELLNPGGGGSQGAAAPRAVIYDPLGRNLPQGRDLESTLDHCLTTSSRDLASARSQSHPFVTEGT